MNGRVEGSLTSNFKIIRQGHVIYFNIFGFYDLNYVENDTNFITLSHLHQKLSRLTNNGKKQCILTTVMYIWRHDICHVTASRWCHICQNVSPISSNRYAEAIFVIGIIKKVTGEKHQGGVVSTPPGRPRVKRRRFRPIAIRHIFPLTRPNISPAYGYPLSGFYDHWVQVWVKMP